MVYFEDSDDEALHRWIANSNDVDDGDIETYDLLRQNETKSWQSSYIVALNHAPCDSSESIKNLSGA